MWVKTNPFIPSNQSQQSRRQFCFLIDAGSFPPPRINKNRRDAKGCSEVSSRRRTQTRFLMELGTAPCQANGNHSKEGRGGGRKSESCGKIIPTFSPPPLALTHLHLFPAAVTRENKHFSDAFPESGPNHPGGGAFLAGFFFFFFFFF